MWRFHFLFWKTGKDNPLLPVILVLKVDLIPKTQPPYFESIISFRVDGDSLCLDPLAVGMGQCGLLSLPPLTLQGHVMDRRKKALTDYKKLRAFFVEEEEHFLQEAEKDEGASEDDELADPADRFRSLLQAVSELEKKHRNLGLSMLLQVPPG